MCFVQVAYPILTGCHGNQLDALMRKGSMMVLKFTGLLRFNRVNAIIFFR